MGTTAETGERLALAERGDDADPLRQILRQPGESIFVIQGQRVQLVQGKPDPVLPGRHAQGLADRPPQALPVIRDLQVQPETGAEFRHKLAGQLLPAAVCRIAGEEQEGVTLSGSLFFQRPSGQHSRLPGAGLPRQDRQPVLICQGPQFFFLRRPVYESSGAAVRQEKLVPSHFLHRIRLFCLFNKPVHRAKQVLIDPLTEAVQVAVAVQNGIPAGPDPCPEILQPGVRLEGSAELSGQVRVPQVKKGLGVIRGLQGPVQDLLLGHGNRISLGDPAVTLPDHPHEEGPAPVDLIHTHVDRLPPLRLLLRDAPAQVHSRELHLLFVAVGGDHGKNLFDQDISLLQHILKGRGDEDPQLSGSCPLLHREIPSSAS